MADFILTNNLGPVDKASSDRHASVHVEHRYDSGLLRNRREVAEPEYCSCKYQQLNEVDGFIMGFTLATF